MDATCRWTPDPSGLVRVPACNDVLTTVTASRLDRRVEVPGRRPEKVLTAFITAPLVALLALYAPSEVVRADIFGWEYINPATNLYTTGEVTLTSISTQPGDFDSDVDVDGRDFLAWQSNPGVGSLADWQANNGTDSLVAANIAVPEPASWMFGALFL